MASPTKPRGPIAAMYSSPGPVYNLPPVLGYSQHSPSSRHRRQPAFSFGMPHSAFEKSDKSPGPCYFVPQRLYHTGMDGIPSYSISGRPRDLTIHTTPGPGAYNKDASDNIAFKKNPSYSLRGRHDARGSDSAPAPNAYVVPTTIGKAVTKRQCPSYSILGRSKIGGIAEDLSKTPGPGTYNVKTGQSMPCYSITGRNELPGDSTTKPGPGAHDVTTSYNLLNRPAAHSFGVRHSQYIAPLILSGDND